MAGWIWAKGMQTSHRGYIGAVVTGAVLVFLTAVIVGLI
jgi:hypothetical protein